MSLVKGIDLVVEIFDGGIWKGFACARDVNMNIDTELIETSVTGSGDYKTFEPTVHSATVGFSGLSALNIPAFVTFPELQAWQLAKTKLLFRLIMTAQDLSVYIRQFYTFITNSTDTGSFDGVATFQLSTRITGSLSTSFTPPSPTTGNMYRFPAQGATYPTTPGTSSVTISGLGNKTLIGVFKDGRGNNDIILSGTPVNQEVLYETVGSDGVFSWAFPFEPGESFFIQYQNQ